MTVTEICEKIWEIEKKYDLFNQKIQDVYFWKLARFSVFIEITTKTKIYTQAHSKPYNSMLDKFKDLPKILINTYIYSVGKRKSKRDILVFESPRKVLVENKHIDIYTNELVKQLEKENESYEIVDGPYLKKHYDKPNEKRSYVEHFSIINYLKRKIFKIKLNRDECELIENLENEIYNKFKVKINLKEKIQDRVVGFKFEKEFYRGLLRKRVVKQIYLICSYGQEALIAACKEENVESIELQHGTLGKYHLGYSFPNDKNIPYFPDKLYLFGKYWFNTTPLPLEKKDIEIIGYPYLENRLKKYKDVMKEKNMILFISQGTIGKRLSEAACRFAQKNPKYKIIYKLHLGEFDRWKNDYPELNKAEELENFKVVDNNDINLYEYMAKAEFLVGVYSTVIFEGLTLNCKTILMNLPGIKYMDYLIENDFVKLAQDEKVIVKFIEEDDFKEVDRDYFFKEIEDN